MKKNILKVFAVLLAFVMLFALASCGSKKSNKAEISSGISDENLIVSTVEPVTSEITGTTENSGEKVPESETAVTEKDNEGESDISSQEIHLPIVPLN